MIKLREARYCNLKLLLIFFVIYGHLIEPQIWYDKYLMMQYRFIYLVHMPLFSFLSGLFIKDCDSCIAQLKRLLPTYSILQIFAVILGNGAVKPMTPFWHLWYMLSCSCWIGIAWLWFTYAKDHGKYIILISAIFLGCFAGYINIIGREYSLSRTIVFFPYFWLGILCNRTIEWRKYRIHGIAALLLSIFVLFILGDTLKTTFLYQAEPFGNIKNGFILRLLCYLLGVLLSFFLLTFIPDKRYCFTKSGVNTMPAYILHSPIAGILRELNLYNWVYLIGTIIFLWLICKFYQWHGPMYGILSTE